jgi:diguanylate cyclase (GGDEF)-like protein/PAS domain S-box-containing protein
MPDLLEDFQAAIERAVDESGLIHHVLCDADNRIRHISISIAKLCRRKYFDLLKSDICNLPLLIYVDDSEFVSLKDSCIFEGDLNTEGSKRNYFIFKNLEDDIFPLSISRSQITIMDETLTLYLFIDQSVTESLHRKSALQEKLFHDSSEAIVITDKTPKILSVNRAFTKITGYSEIEAVGQSPGFLSSGYHNKRFYERMWARLKREDRWEGALVNRKKNGEIFSEQCTIRAIRAEGGDVVSYVSIFSEIADSNKLGSDKPSKTVKLDDLTGLPRRAIFEDRLQQAIGYAKRHSLMVAIYYINLDDFRAVNETYDEQVGDLTIKAIARELNTHIRDDDTLARIGGDEYVLLLRDLKPDFDITEFGNRLLTIIEGTHVTENPEINLTASIGVTFFPDDESSAATLIRHANHAMDLAKNDGRNRLVYYSTRKEKQKVLARRAKEAVLEALERDELCLFIQPQYDLQNKKLYGMEFLIRWRMDDGELIYPDSFLNSQKDEELLTRVDKWVIKRAIKILSTELNEVVAAGIKVGVNLTPCSLQDVKFHEWLIELFKGVPREITELIEIEILENDALNNIEVLREFIVDLEPFGVSFSLDDFGTGYSSLSIFNQLAVSTVKIDRSFVKDMVIDLKNLSLVKAICEMSKIFDREIVAEGVEFKEQADLLLNSGCSIVQGFGIAKPMEVDQFREWIKDEKFSDTWGQ